MHRLVTRQFQAGHVGVRRPEWAVLSSIFSSQLEVQKRIVMFAELSDDANAHPPFPGDRRAIDAVTLLRRFTCCADKCAARGVAGSVVRPAIMEGMSRLAGHEDAEECYSSPLCPPRHRRY
jgi:hypothetical protein